MLSSKLRFVGRLNRRCCGGEKERLLQLFFVILPLQKMGKTGYFWKVSMHDELHENDNNSLNVTLGLLLSKIMIRLRKHR